jgi:hypothetical protein
MPISAIQSVLRVMPCLCYLHIRAVLRLGANFLMLIHIYMAWKKRIATYDHRSVKTGHPVRNHAVSLCFTQTSILDIIKSRVPRFTFRDRNSAFQDHQFQDVDSRSWLLKPGTPVGPSLHQTSYTKNEWEAGLISPKLRHYRLIHTVSCGLHVSCWCLT